MIIFTQNWAKIIAFILVNSLLMHEIFFFHSLLKCKKRMNNIIPVYTNIKLGSKINLIYIFK